MPFYRHYFTQADYQLARSRVSDEALNHRSFLGPAGQFRGALGEVAFELWLQHFGINFDFINSTKYDYNVSGVSQLLKVDVKTKARNYNLRSYFEGSIPDYVSEFQEYDYAVFVNLVFGDGPDEFAGFSHAQIGGFANKEIMAAKSCFRKAGEDDFGEPGNKCKIDCHNIKISDAIDPKEWAAKYLL